MRGCYGSSIANTHTDRQSKYSNPRCACAPRVNDVVMMHGELCIYARAYTVASYTHALTRTIIALTVRT